MIIKHVSRLNEGLLEPYNETPNYDDIDLYYSEGTKGEVSVWLNGEYSDVAYSDDKIDASIGALGDFVDRSEAKKIGEEIAQKIKKGQPVTAQYLKSKGFAVSYWK